MKTRLDSQDVGSPDVNNIDIDVGNDDTKQINSANGVKPEITLQRLIKEATNDYLSVLDLNNLPSTDDIVGYLLSELKVLVNLENSLRPKNEKFKMPSKLNNWQIASVMSTIYPIKKVACGGVSCDSEYDVLAIYQSEGPNRGIYVTNDEELRRIARKFDIEMTIRQFEEISAILGEIVERVVPEKNPDLIAVNNGIFNYETKTLLPFSPDYVFLSKSKVDYNPNAVNVSIHNIKDGTDWDVESWMHTLSDDDEVVSLFWEILGAIIRPHVSWNKSAWFYSESGNNGKGTLCELMRQLCGEGSYAAIKLDDMGKDFVLEPLIRSTAIIVDENDVGIYIDKAANLKAIITNDVIQINRKFKQPIPYRFYGFMVQCLNEMPRIKDKSDSFFRRQLFVPFEKCFTGHERKYIKNEYLHRSDVLEYVLYKVLNMNYYNLSEPSVCKTALAEYREYNDPVRQFWVEIEPKFTWKFLPNDFLYDLYRAWFDKNISSGKIVGKNSFLKELRKVKEVQIEYNTAKQVRRKSVMNTPEPLIIEYNLKNWMNQRYQGSSDLKKLCTPENLDNTVFVYGFERFHDRPKLDDEEIPSGNTGEK